MADAPTYASYVEAGGQLAEGSFNAALPQATTLVDAAIWPNAVTETVLVSYQRAVSAVVDLVHNGEADALVASEGVGRAQTAYNSPNVLMMAGLSAHPVARAIRSHLTGTYL